MTVMREEIFGPIVPFMRVQSEDEAVALANDSPLGLNAYVFTKDRATARRLSERIEAGQRRRQRRPHELRARPRRRSAASSSRGSAACTATSRSATCATPKYVSFDRVPPPARDPLWFPYTARELRLDCSAASACSSAAARWPSAHRRFRAGSASVRLGAPRLAKRGGLGQLRGP